VVADLDLSAAACSRLVNTTAIGPFSWRWPEGIEKYERGWLAIAEVGGREFHIRHGVGRRDAFGRSRLRSVTWVEGEVAVEGVEADDFSTSQSLVSLIKTTKKHLRIGDPLPPEYEPFPIAVFADEVVGPHSFHSLAVKLPVDDVEGWSGHALLRSAAWGRLSVTHRDRPSLPSPSALGPLPASTPFDCLGEQQVAVASALLEFGVHHRTSEKAIAVDFTTNPAANDLVRTDALAFLCAVIFDQNIPAERAWLAPLLLKERLGYLDPQSVASAD